MLDPRIGLHPTRWARNERKDEQSRANGNLGLHPTRWARNGLYSQFLFQPFSFVSIPHGGLGTLSTVRHWLDRGIINVSIPHGGLGTPNKQEQPRQSQESPSHTVGSEPQITTLTKIRHINHFVKVAPLSNEVNFPKSEIMQS